MNDWHGVRVDAGGGHVTELGLGNNALTGPIPPELGSLDSLESLYLYDNALTGPIPPELGNLDRLRDLRLNYNALTGPIPLSQCAPAAAYLTQAVQSREHPVPLVAREDALLRAFVTAANPGGHTMPRVVARLYRDGDEVYEADIPAGSNPLPDSIDESILKASANAVIPGRVVRPGLELVVEVDPDGTLHDSVGVTRRIPADGRLAIEVLEAPRFDLTLIPFLYEPDPDSSIIGRVGEMAADEDDHDLLQQTAYLLGVEEMDVTDHSPVEVSSRSASRVLSETEAIRALEGGTGHWMGMMPWFSDVGGVAYLPGWTSASRPYSAVIVHELGHNFSLPHAPCGGAPGPDPDFPDPRGRIGAWGYALDTVVRSPSGRYFRKGELVRPSVPDLMSYCYNPEWISDYFFAKAHRYRVDTEGGGSGGRAPGPSGALAAPVGRRRLDRDAAPGARIRRRRSSRAPRGRRRPCDRGPDRRRERGCRRVRIRASGPSGVGGTTGWDHADGAGRCGRGGDAGPRPRCAHGDPPGPANRRGAGDTQGRAGTGRRPCRNGGAAQPGDTRSGGLAAMTDRQRAPALSSTSLMVAIPGAT
ncbi:MAG: hypothetical protein J4F34_01320 [Gemmatimonadetes bacterium]|nr:hypothetical protein [Gemmatimonadota bacterium]